MNAAVKVIEKRKRKEEKIMNRLSYSSEHDLVQGDDVLDGIKADLGLLDKDQSQQQQQQQYHLHKQQHQQQRQQQEEMESKKPKKRAAVQKLDDGKLMLRQEKPQEPLSEGAPVPDHSAETHSEAKFKPAIIEKKSKRDRIKEIKKKNNETKKDFEQKQQEAIDK